MIKEFKDFINKGGVFEAAVGLIMALAFTPVVQGMVDFIIMPIIARIFGEPDFSSITIGLGGGENGARIMIGSWITVIIGFVMIASVVFMLVKAYNAAVAPKEADAKPSEADLLIEIRDLLAKR